jgi:hypothetical protein
MYIYFLFLRLPSFLLALAWILFLVDLLILPFLYCWVARAFALAARPLVSIGYLRFPGNPKLLFGSFFLLLAVILGDLLRRFFLAMHIYPSFTSYVVFPVCGWTSCFASCISTEKLVSLRCYCLASCLGILF